MQTDKSTSVALIKAVILVVFLVSAVLIVRLTSLSEYLVAEKLGAFIKNSGFWAPLLLIIIYAAGVSLFVPATVFTTAAAVIFGPYWGFLYAWVGALLGASSAFFIGRYLGRDFAASLIGERLKKYDDMIALNGFTTVLYLRLVYMPFTPMNFGMGLTRVRFWEYFWGTAFGIIVATFIIAFFVGTVKKVWVSGRWDLLLTWEVLLTFCLFIFSFFIPILMQRLRISRGAND
ncbi:MAG: TVP38/TMEM64 family protein [Desulforhabdus sp.]|jgi:uncharacterized membrane protein YdjX (TVP38/TMEM64 family)|nr:TVP38/TMEM64 family protein [Desulforhabdus sp.]